MAPPVPQRPTISNVTTNSMRVAVQDGGANGTAIELRQLGWGTNPNAPQTTQYYTGGAVNLNGLAQQTTYYVWARSYSNRSGYSAWSARANATTGTAARAPDPPSTPWLYNVKATSVDIGWNANYDGGSAINGYQVGWGTNPDWPVTVQWTPWWMTIYGLQPGALYYFWVQAQNSVGWSAWSGRASNRTVSGSLIKVGAEWRTAVPYVKVDGVWRLAQPWVRDTGAWRLSS